MSTDTLQLTSLIPADPPTIFAAWLDSAGHTAMTGAAARVEARAGSQFSAWDGYISGTTLEVDPGRRIVQTWRTTEFPEDAPDSQLEILLEPEGQGTRVTLYHTEIPLGQGDRYRSGWEEFYFAPMRRFFAQPDGEVRILAIETPAEERATTRPGKSHGQRAPTKHPPKAKAKAKAKAASKKKKTVKKAAAKKASAPKKKIAKKKAKARPAKKTKRAAAKKKRR
jgi:uncharacterized protein YndB with AHSA1/START domain